MFGGAEGKAMGAGWRRKVVGPVATRLGRLTVTVESLTIELARSASGPLTRGELETQRALESLSDEMILQAAAEAVRLRMEG